MSTPYKPAPTDPQEVMAALAHTQALRQAYEALDEKLIEGLQSGPAIEMEDLEWHHLDAIASQAAGKSATS